MARVLPIAMAQAKEEYENFFIELYTMKLPSGEMRLVACDEDIDFDGKSFMAVPLQRNDFKQSVDGKIDNMELQKKRRMNLKHAQHRWGSRITTIICSKYCI